MRPVAAGPSVSELLTPEGTSGIIPVPAFLERDMALPPEPLDEVLPSAKWVVEAEVSEVLESAPTPKQSHPPGWTGPGKVGKQIVKLVVKRVLLGSEVPREIVAVKPEAGYGLRAGNKGPFLLDAARPRPNILGQFGPDTWRVEKIEEMLRG